MKTAWHHSFIPAFLPVWNSLFLCLILFFTSQLEAQPFPDQLNLTQTGPDSFLVSFKTTKGEFIMNAHRDWGPLGCDRFYVLAKNGYYNNNVIFRVAPTKSSKGGFIAQFGIGNSKEVNEAWDKHPIPDEQVIRPHQIGSVCFARGGPNTRNVQLAISLTPCKELDTVSYEGVSGFPTIAEVIDGMPVLESFNRQYGNSVFDGGDSLMIGREYFDRVFPGLDRINSVTVTKIWRKKKEK